MAISPSVSSPDIVQNSGMPVNGGFGDTGEKNELQPNQEGGKENKERRTMMIYCSASVERLRKGEDRESKMLLKNHNMISFAEGVSIEACIAIIRINIEGIVGLAMNMAGVNSNIFPSYDKMATITNGHLLIFVTAGISLDECYKVDLVVHC